MHKCTCMSLHELKEPTGEKRGAKGALGANNAAGYPVPTALQYKQRQACCTAIAAYTGLAFQCTMDARSYRRCSRQSTRCSDAPHRSPHNPHPTLPPPGMDLYFKRHDGCAVTCDDFLAAMADANGVDLSGIAGWYSQAGTPHLDVSTSFNAGEAGRGFPLKNGLDSERRPGGCIGLR